LQNNLREQNAKCNVVRHSESLIDLSVALARYLSVLVTWLATQSQQAMRWIRGRLLSRPISYV